MDSLFDHKYFCCLYTLNLKSIIGVCKVDEFDALNGNGAEYKLNEIHAYLDTYPDCPKEIYESEWIILRILFADAVMYLDERYFKQTGHHLANYNVHKALINNWNNK